MQMIEVSKLKPHLRNQEFFDDIEGEQYEKFKKSIQEDGIITPLIVAPDMTIISGHQRLKASKDLGIELVPVIIREDLIDESEKLKKLLATNFGRLKNSPVKQGKVYEEYERLCGVRQGSMNSKGFNVGDKLSLTQEQIAKELGTDVRTIQRLKKLRTLSPELQQLIDNGTVKYTTALNVWAKLSNEEQQKFIEELGKDKIADMTRKQTEEYLKQKEELEEENSKIKQLLEEEKSKAPEIVQVDNTDYTIVDKNKELEKKIIKLASEKNELEIDLDLMTKKADAFEQDSLDYKKMKEDITYLTKQKDDLGRQIQAITDISGLVVEIDDLIKSKLAPVRYSRSLLEAKNDDIVMRNLTEIVDVIEGWCYEMKQYIPNKINYVEVK
ncbi:ParB N-terminal domain-containing protein [Clostridium sp. WILCCON 0269]|uniref:ParB N-terminal domain-containing protein n=1 Tax=Candidatus Clostridium eludens TaxID=3381663 RepID=A0ABW8SEI1_9CLOT